MTAAGRIIRDAWAFGIIPESETCAGWNMQTLHDLWTRTHVEWEKYAHQVNQLPGDFRQRYLHIQRESFDKARVAGWEPAWMITTEHRLRPVTRP